MVLLGWLIFCLIAGTGIIGVDRLAASSVTTAKIADDAVTLAKMAGLPKEVLYMGMLQVTLLQVLNWRC
jgi:hypothetical protein